MSVASPASAGSEVSVVVPTRGASDLLSRALRSVAEQSVPPAEIVVVGDGCALELPDAVGGVVVRVVRLPEARGGSGARNAGVAAARGRLIAFLDDDDAWLPHKLARQLDLRSACGARVVGCRVVAVLPGHEQVWPRRLPDAGEDIADYLCVRRSLLRGDTLVQTSMLLVERELLLEVPFREGLPRHQEWDWLIRANRLAGAQLVMHPEALSVWDCLPRDNRISGRRDWSESLRWLELVRPLISARAYGAFALTWVAVVAKEQGDYRALRDLRRLAVRRGAPGLPEQVVWASIVLAPGSASPLKQVLKRLVAGTRGSA